MNFNHGPAAAFIAILALAIVGAFWLTTVGHPVPADELTVARVSDSEVVVVSSFPVYYPNIKMWVASAKTNTGGALSVYSCDSLAIDDSVVIYAAMLVRGFRAVLEEYDPVIFAQKIK